MATSRTTTDHDEIRNWVEQRGGSPAVVKGTQAKASDSRGMLRIDFPGYGGEATLEHIDWDTWFQSFDAHALAFLCQDETADGRPSRFNKLITQHSASKARHAAAEEEE